MCPACYATVATVLAGTASASGLTAVIAAVVYKRKLSMTSPELPIQEEKK